MTIPVKEGFFMRGKENKSAVSALIRSVLIGLAVVLAVSSVILLIAAALISKEVIGENMLQDCAIVASLIGGFAGSFVSVRIRGSAALLTGLITGAAFIILKLLVTLMSDSSRFDGGAFFVTSIFLLAGAILGAMPKKRQRRKRHP